MSLVQVSVTATATLLAVMLGGWLTVRSQDRHWRRDHQRQWRDIRLAAYSEYLSAFREFVAYVLQPTAQVVAVPRPVEPYDLMPFFDAQGSAYRERLEASKTAVRLVSGGPDVVHACNAMVRHARLLAADRASHDIGSVPPARFQDLWSAERQFMRAARAELGLASDFEVGGGPRPDYVDEAGPAPKSPPAACDHDRPEPASRRPTTFGAKTSRRT
ncbi:hypothetical protein V6U80_18690 [Micromonospora sp. CPCC 205543]